MHHIKIKQRTLLFVTTFVMAIIPILQMQAIAHAQLDPKQKQLYDAGIDYYDINYASNDCSVASEGASNGTIYVVGDSYSVGMQQAGLEGDLKDLGYTNIIINGHTGRSINGAGNPPNASSATTAIKDDTEKIKTAGTIIIVLGTNPEDYDKAIPVFMKKLNTINGGARKFWVNTNNAEQSKSQILKTNASIDKYSAEFKYSVIDWFARLAASPGLSNGLHPTPNGYVELNTLVGKALGKMEATSTTSTSTGSNPEKIWAYFIGKGLTPAQTAGLMGNLQAESGFMPDRVQGSGTKTSPNLLPEYYDKVGYGLAQWTSVGRQKNLIAFAQSQGKIESDLIVQLDFILKEMGGGSGSVLKALKASTTLTEATDIVLNRYERPRDRNLNKRVGLANKILEKYGGIAGASFGCSAAGQAGAGGWDLGKGENAMTYYSQQDNKWKATGYGQCTIGEGGCGPTSAAMIIATLTGNKAVTPPVIAKKLEALGAAPKCGTDWDKWDELMKGYDLNLSNISLNFDQANKVLQSGGLVLASFGIDSDTPSLFTSGRHLMVIRKINADGTYSIADPISLARFSNTQTFTKQVLLSRDGKGGGAINNMWAVSK